MIYMSVKNTKYKKNKIRHQSYSFIAFAADFYNNEQKELMKKWSKEQGDVYGYLEIDGPYQLNNFERLRKALTIMTSPSNKEELWYIKHQYDYAWIKRAIDFGLIRNYEKYLNKSNPKFLSFLNDLHIPTVTLPDDKSLGKYYRKVAPTVKYLPWHYNDHCAIHETNRRNVIAGKFIEIMNAI